MILQVGDTVQYTDGTTISNKYIGIVVGVGKDGAVVSFKATKFHPTRSTGYSFGSHCYPFALLSKVQSLSKEEEIVEKIKDLESRFKNKKLEKTRLPVLSLPK